MANKWKPYDIGDYGGFAGALAEALGGYWSDSAAEGNSPTGMDITNMAFQEYMQNQQNQFTQNMYAEDRAWQEEMYERYQTIPAQVRQMQEAGLNPALMYGQGAGSPSAVSSGQMPSSGSGAAPSSSGRSPIQGFQKAMSAIQAVLGMLSSGNSVAQGISQLVRNRTMNEKDVAQAELFRKQAYLAENEGKIKEIEASYADMRNFLEINGLKFDNDLKQANWSKVWSEIDLNNSTIELQGKQYDFLSFQSQYFSALTDKTAQETSLLVQKVAIAKIDAENAKVLQPYAEKMAKAQLALTQAQGAKAIAEAQKAFDEACKIYLDNVVMAGMIDQGYIDEKMKQMRKQTKGMTAQNVNTWFNSIATGIEAGCRLAGTIVTGGLAGAVSSAPSVKSSAPLLYGSGGQPISTITY